MDALIAAGDRFGFKYTCNEEQADEQSNAIEISNGAVGSRHICHR